ncbi:MAG TPA: prolipoprotein diacylglyceryl transferase family protein [Silvibacterium sp.]|nr:prolipoprotein diacylglyceryl transferase family protein [Silvibacterium sp.]
MHPLLFQLGHFAIPTYGALVALALVAALASLLHFARRLALDPNKLWNLGLIGIFSALIATRLLLVVNLFPAFRAHPAWVLGLTSISNSWIVFAAPLIGFAAAMLYALAEGLPLLRVLDCIAPPIALALAIAGIGAFLAGVGYGLPDRGRFSITYTSPLARYWYHTPLGLSMYPVQLFQAIASLAILAALVWGLPRAQHDGELAGAWLFLYGVTGSFIEHYRATTPNRLLADQVVLVLAVIASLPLLLQRKAAAATGGYTGV